MSYITTFFDRATGKKDRNDANIRCSSNTCVKGVQSYLKSNIKDMIEKLEAVTNDPTLADQAIAYCKSEMASKSIQYGHGQLKEFIPQVKENFLKNVMGKYSPQSKSSFKDYLHKELQFIFPEPQKDAVDKMTSDINILHTNKGVLSEKFMTTSSRHSSQIWALVRIFDSTQEGDRLLTLAPCGGTFHEVGTESDSFYSVYFNKTSGLNPRYGHDTIIASAFSCLHPHTGKGVIAHELGHALSSVLFQGKLSAASKEKFLKVRRCSTFSQHKKARDLDRRFSYQGDSQFTEEDTADVLAWFAHSEGKNLTSCALMMPTPNLQSYENLSFDPVPPARSHSSPFLRAIREAIHKDWKLPSSCQEVIRRNPQYDLKKCSLE